MCQKCVDAVKRYYPRELGRRTRIHLKDGMIELVTETADEIHAMVEKSRV